MKRIILIIIATLAIAISTFAPTTSNAAVAQSTAEAPFNPYMDDSGDNRQTGGDYFYIYMGNGVFWRCVYSTGACGPF